MTAAFFPVTTADNPLMPPPGWRWSLLREVARLESGHTPSRRQPEYWEGGQIPWLSLKDIGGLAGRYVTETEDMPTSEGIENSSARVLPKGTVAFCRTASVGKLAILGRDMATSQDFANWVCGPELLPEYLYEALRASQGEFDKEKQGTTHKTIYMPVLERFRVLVPPLPEQRRIADIIERADAIRRKRKEAIALTEELLRSAFLEMFGDVLLRVEDGALPAGWRRARVDELKASGDYTCVGGPFGSNLTSKDYVGEGVPVIRGANLGAKTNTFIDGDFVFVSPAKAAELEQNMAYPGDLVFTQRGTLGQVAIIPLSARYPRYVVSQSQMKLTPNTALVSPLFLHSFFCTERMQQYVASHALTTGVPHINLGILRAMPVIVPPKAMQERFERVAAAKTSMMRKQIAAHDAAHVLFDSLVDQAFRGELTRAQGPSKPELGPIGAEAQ